MCHLLALLEAHHILHVSRIRVKCDSASFRVRSYAILMALLFWDLSLVILCRIFRSSSRTFIPLQMETSPCSMHDIISQRYEVPICTAVQDSRLYHVTFSKFSAGKCFQKCRFNASFLPPLLLVYLLMPSSLSTNFLQVIKRRMWLRILENCGLTDSKT